MTSDKSVAKALGLLRSALRDWGMATNPSPDGEMSIQWMVAKITLAIEVLEDDEGAEKRSLVLMQSIYRHK